VDPGRAVYAEWISGGGSHSRPGARRPVRSRLDSGGIRSWAVYERIRTRRRLELGAWLIGGATSDGIATWSMHYTGMLALQLPTPLYLHWPSVLLSLMVSIAGCAAALWVVSRGALRWRRALAVSVFIGAIGISGLHYTAMAGISLPSAQHHQPFIVILAVIAAVAVSWTAVGLTFLLRPGSGHIHRNDGAAWRVSLDV
jgi:NO-binding membrane sensor protein with MHYT domain